MRGKFVSVHAMEACGGSRDVVPLIFRHVFKIAKSDYYLRRVAILSIRLEQLASHWMDLCQILYWRSFGKSVEKILLPLKAD
jgi:hypothetical protein